jgi:hypothetical protein
MRAWRWLRVLVLIGVSGATIVVRATSPAEPVPSDPLELATGPVQVADTPEKRGAALGLLELARENHNLHRGPAFTLKASFESFGTSAYTGPGRLEETWLSGRNWRWMTKLGDYSQVRIFANGAAYDQTPTPIVMPLRAQMVRSAVFWPVAANRPQSTIRTAQATWLGRTITCVLIGDGRPGEAAATGRAWEEVEYCIDPQSGLLQTYSVAPGIYSTYDYSNGLPFHGRMLPRDISIVEGGIMVLRIRLESVADPGQVSAASLTPTNEMLANGPRPTVSGPFRFALRAWSAAANRVSATHPVVVNAILGEDGTVLDAEPLQIDDPDLSRAAVDLVRQRRWMPIAPGRRLQREAFINVSFAPQP